jgi:hypothetical protein
MESTIAPNPEPIPESKPSRSRSWRDILLLAFFLASILVLLGRAIYLFIPGGTSGSTMLPENVYGAVSMLFCIVLLVPAVVLTIRHLRGQTIQKAKIPPVKFWQVAGLAGIWVIDIIFVSFINNLFSYSWVVAIPFFLVGIAIPIICLIWIAAGGLPTGSRRRLWAVFGLGLTAGPALAITLELLSVGAALLVAGLVATFDPTLLSTLRQLQGQITNANNMQELIPILAPYLNNPWLLLGILVFVAGIGPLIEEAFKPLAVWLVGKRLHSPAEGFALGALCGAGFALLEGMLVTSGSTDMLGVGLAGRATSSLMHITASALMGWAIASALLEKRYGRLILTYILSVSIHGLWNGAVLLTVYGGLKLSLTGTSNVDLFGGLATAAGIGVLVVLLLAILVILPILNHRLRPVMPKQDDIIVPPSSLS